MRWGIEYTSDTGIVGLVLFTTSDIREANDYVDNMCSQYGFNHLSNLKEIPNGCCISELIKLFPGYLPTKTKPKGDHQFRTPFEKPWSS